MEHGASWRQVWPERVQGDFQRDFLLDMGPTDSVDALLYTLSTHGVRATGRAIRANHPAHGQPARMLALHARPQS
eukprot:11626694-Prorocentrum_lima.AAC.1